MKENVGPKDRTIRAIVGPALLALGAAWFAGRRRSWPGVATMLGGALLTESAITRVCPAVNALGLRRTP